MQKIYHNPPNPGGLGNVYKLCNAFRNSSGVTPWLHNVKCFLLGQHVYILAKAARHFPRNRVLVNNIDKQFQTDLVDMVWLMSVAALGY